MDEKVSTNRFNDDDCPTTGRYSHLQTFVNNLPYLVMIILGATIFLFTFGSSTTRFTTASIYFLYGIVGAFWIMVFMCPYCRFWGTQSCPCGYGILAERFTRKKNPQLFSEKFKKHIPVIVPLWFIPVISGGIFIVINFSFLLLALVIVFVIDSFIILPVFSKKHGCTDCPQKQDCPWMKGKA